MSDEPLPRLRIRVVFGDKGRFGPGKADLLEAIMAHGSISAAGRELGMSWKRAWSLVDEMNRMFRAPLVETARGGAAGGGAHVTDTGREVLALYRTLDARLAGEHGAELRALADLLPDCGAPSAGDTGRGIAFEDLG